MRRAARRSGLTSAYAGAALAACHSPVAADVIAPALRALLGTSYLVGKRGAIEHRSA
ncbi:MULTISPECIES: hypothetical protein [Sorangium]|uniref:Secreted protein n=1 Tax=Sorangium cellulosum (strain So ce56) TaxID=448385 RepID=A9F326_SORC5|nr:hypothetical protein [Sorangium cellulosum]CAN94542.1 putative secreted protein [Sorangium cellulosum So ce56]